MQPSRWLNLRRDNGSLLGRYRQRAKRERGVRILACYLPVKSPWLNAIEPKWVHGKKAITEPERKLTAQEVKDRVYGYYGCEQVEPLKQKVA